MALEGNRAEKMIDVDRFELSLPSGASLRATGHENLSTRLISATLDAARVTYPSDLPFWKSAAVQGAFDSHARITGTWDDPSLKGTVQSASLSVQHQPLGKTSASFVWNKDHLEIPSFHSEPGIDGHYTDGQGLLKIQNTSIGKWQINQGTLRFARSADQLRVQELFLETSDAVLRAEGKAVWPGQGGEIKTMSLEGRGEARSTQSPPAWDVPFTLIGHLDHEGTGWGGSARVLASHPILRKSFCRSDRSHSSLDAAKPDVVGRTLGASLAIERIPALGR